MGLFKFLGIDLMSVFWVPVYVLLPFLPQLVEVIPQLIERRRSQPLEEASDHGTVTTKTFVQLMSHHSLMN